MAKGSGAHDVSKKRPRGENQPHTQSHTVSKDTNDRALSSYPNLALILQVRKEAFEKNESAKGQTRGLNWTQQLSLQLSLHRLLPSLGLNLLNPSYSRQSNQSYTREMMYVQAR